VVEANEVGSHPGEPGEGFILLEVDKF